MSNTQPDANPGTTTTVMAASLASIGLAIAIYMSGNKKGGLFVGLWAPTILGIGTYLNTDRTLQALANANPRALDAA
jgi:hypothetical protein